MLCGLRSPSRASEVNHAQLAMVRRQVGLGRGHDPRHVVANVHAPPTTDSAPSTTNSAKSSSVPSPTASSEPSFVPDPTVQRAQNVVVPPEGMVCELSGVSWSGSAILAHVCLRNTGKNEFRFKHDHTAIKFNLLVTVYDDKGGVVGKQDWNMLHSPYGEYIELVIPSGGESSSDVTLLPMRNGQILHLAPGRYSLQVAFPFHNYEYSASERVPFVVPKQK